MPPTMTGFPSSDGFTNRSTDTKKVSKSKCKIVLSIIFFSYFLPKILVCSKKVVFLTSF